MHFMNPGFTWLAMANIFFSGLLFSLFVYYFDSIWCPFGIHTGWNFSQSILLGLPNSGLVMPYSIFELDTASARNSFVYNVAFGIEGTVFSTIVLALACLVTFLIGRKRAGKPLDIWEKKDIQSA
ncbi:MAG: CPBP family intramembrane metalloprotease, partial [Erysipelotrichaceae bacterium]|nr:CPBP family intramembrane metalloprotease [Erysipelotrichaceae bacterium]